MVSDSVRPHRRQPTRLPYPWDSPGKNTGMGCHFLLQCMKVKLLSRVRLLETPRTAAYQAPPSTGFSRQEYWTGLPLPSPNNSLLNFNAHGFHQDMSMYTMKQFTQAMYLTNKAFRVQSFGKWNILYNPL